MKIIAHQGFWKKQKEKNSFIAFRRAIKSGYGVEFDIRDYKGELVVAHNMATPNSPKLYEVFVKLVHLDNFPKVIFAINIKCDSIESKVFKFVETFKITKNSFVFDISQAQKELFYLPQVKLQDELRKEIAWFKTTKSKK